MQGPLCTGEKGKLTPAEADILFIATCNNTRTSRAHSGDTCNLSLPVFLNAYMIYVHKTNHAQEKVLKVQEGAWQ